VNVCKCIRTQFTTKMFSERPVVCDYFDPDRHKQGELDIIDKIIINFE
jgi:hypothetical protein